MAEPVVTADGSLALVPCAAPTGRCIEGRIPRLQSMIEAEFHKLGARGEARGFACDGNEYLRVVCFDPFGVTWYRAEVRVHA
jgi:hypothetical protein